MSYLFPKWKKNEILNWRQRFEKSHYAVLVSTFFQPPVAPVEITYNFNLSTHQFLGSPENPPEWSPVSQKKQFFGGDFPKNRWVDSEKRFFFGPCQRWFFLGVQNLSFEAVMKGWQQKHFSCAIWFGLLTPHRLNTLREFINWLCVFF